MRKYKSWKNRIFDISVILLLFLLGAFCMLPLLHVIALSFSNKVAVMEGRVLIWPVDVTSTPYRAILEDSRFIQSFWVSVKRVVLGVGINMILTILAAFSLSQTEREFPARKYYMWVMVFAMLFGAPLIPWYFVIKETGLIDTIWAMILPGALPVYNTILLMNFFRELPKEIKESALMDGVNPLQMLIKIIIPLSKPAIATIAVFAVVWHWNSFFDGMLLINTPEKAPLQTYIYNLINSSPIVNTSMTAEQQEALSSMRTYNAAKVVVAALPVAVFYPFMQRFFVSGLTLGSVKG